MRTRYLLIAALLSLCLMLCCACSTVGTRPSPTRTQSVPIEVLQFVPVPIVLTLPTPEPPRPGPLYRDMVQWIVTGWRPALSSCNSDKAAVSMLGEAARKP